MYDVVYTLLLVHTAVFIQVVLCVLLVDHHVCCFVLLCFVISARAWFVRFDAVFVMLITSMTRTVLV